MNAWYGEDFRLGMLGGGQLGRMLIQEALNYDVHVHCLDPDANAPCRNIASSFTQGALTDFETVYHFGKDKQVLSVEIEHVNTEALERLEHEGVKVYPQAAILRMIQDKGLQKQFYAEHGIPTSDFTLYANAEEVKQHANLPFVQKMRKGGYDGKGVQLIRTSEDLHKLFDVPCVVEELVDFEKELAVIVARNAKGETKSFPTVECEFNPTANLVEFLFSPAEISPEIEQEAQRLALEVITKLDMVGLLAVEFFLTKTGALLVNEIAPRPHNSGHHTIECNLTSQFEQHLRSILNLPLGDTSLIHPGVMLNLLGAEGYEGPAFYEGLEEVMQEKGVFIHLYGKATTKAYRKMGHMTCIADTLTEAKQKGRALNNKLIIRTR